MKLIAPALFSLLVACSGAKPEQTEPAMNSVAPEPESDAPQTTAEPAPTPSPLPSPIDPGAADGVTPAPPPGPKPTVTPDR